MLMIVFVQTTCPHQSGIDIEYNQQIDRSMSLVFKLAPDELSRTQSFGRSTTFKSLNVRLLIYANNNLASFVKPFDIFIAPKNLGRPTHEFRVNGCGLPIATTMRLQTGSSQNASDRRIVDRVNNSFLDHYFLERATVPSCNLQSICAWLGARYPLNRDALERGKKRAVARFAAHQKLHRRHAPSSVATMTRWPCDSFQPRAGYRRFVHLDPVPAKRGLYWQLVGSVAHLLRSRSNSADQWRLIYIFPVCVPSPIASSIRASLFRCRGKINL